jgi:large subunit ribosomal protein L25
MQNTKSIAARLREELGSRAAGRIRRKGEVPGILLGRGVDPVPLAVPTRDLELLHHHGAHLVALEFGQESVVALIREVQMDSLGKHLIHVDFDRIREGEKVELDIELRYFGLPKVEGAVFQVLFGEVTVSCLPGAIPDRIEVDVRELKKGDEIRAKQIALPEGVELVDPKPEEIIAIFAEIRLEEEAPEEGASAEPEVISAREKAAEGTEEAKD